MRLNKGKLTLRSRLFQRLKDRSTIGFIIVLFGVFWMSAVQADTNNNPAPLVTINTIAFDSASKQGIAVGLNRFCGNGTDAPKCFYENPGQSSDVQMLVLDRSTVLPVSFTGAPDGNLSFSTDAAGLTALNNALVSLKATNPDNLLVILAYNSSNPVVFSPISRGAAGHRSREYSTPGETVVRHRHSRHGRRKCRPSTLIRSLTTAPMGVSKAIFKKQPSSVTGKSLWGGASSTSATRKATP